MNFCHKCRVEIGEPGPAIGQIVHNKEEALALGVPKNQHLPFHYDCYYEWRKHVYEPTIKQLRG